jgi:hypothetical protein
MKTIHLNETFRLVAWCLNQLRYRVPRTRHVIIVVNVYFRVQSFWFEKQRNKLFCLAKYGGVSVSTVSCATQISFCASCCVAWTYNLDVITTLNVAHSFRRSTATFQHNPRAHWRIKLIPPRSFQNSSAVEIRFSHSQSFTNSHFHFFTRVE